MTEFENWQAIIADVLNVSPENNHTGYYIRR